MKDLCHAGQGTSIQLHVAWLGGVSWKSLVSLLSFAGGHLCRPVLISVVPPGFGAGWSCLTGNHTFANKYGRSKTRICTFSVGCRRYYFNNGNPDNAIAMIWNLTSILTYGNALFNCFLRALVSRAFIRQRASTKEHSTTKARLVPRHKTAVHTDGRTIFPGLQDGAGYTRDNDLLFVPSCS